MYTLILVSLALIGNGNVYGLGNPYRCDESYTFNGHQQCFKAFEQPELAYLDAGAACLKDGFGLLADVNIRKGDNDLIRDLLTEGRRYWIGFIKANVTEGSRLVDLFGDDVSFTVPWASGEPNNLGGNEACVEIIGNEQGTWNDKECSTKRPFVCMREAIYDESQK